MDFIKQFNDARRVSVPLIAIKTPDPQSTIRTITAQVGDAPILYWDVMRALVGVGTRGKAQIVKICGGPEQAQKLTMRPANMLEKVKDTEEDTIVFMNLAHMFWQRDGETVRQGIWNLRDPFKSNGRILILLVVAGMTLPPELGDILVLDEPLPNEKELKKIIEETYQESGYLKSGQKVPELEMRRVVDAVIGLSAFRAEQTTAMNLSKNGGMNYEGLWETKKSIIESTRGLSVWRGGEKFSDIGGMENAKKYFKALLEGKNPPRVIVFIDEIEKAFAGSGTDLSGVKTEMTGTMLTWMQDHNAMGSLFLGPPGSGKTLLAKAIGNEGEIPTIAFDFGGMQSSLVGTSSENLKVGLKVVEAVGAGSPLFIGTCNEIRGLDSALKRRFNLATFFCDLPTPEERDLVWNIYLKKYNLEKTNLPNDKNWTGAEIKTCCFNAWNLGWSLEESAKYVVPVAVSAESEIKELREYAQGRYISAAKAGQYRMEVEKSEQTVSRKRKFRVIDMDVDAIMPGKPGKA